MKKIIFSFIILSALFLLSGCTENGSEVTQATNVQQEDNNPKPGQELLDVNCVPPNLRLDVQLNRRYCGSEDCLINFKGYWWWTNYQFTGAPNWFWNQGQAWSPRNTFVDSEGLHLLVRKDDLGGGLTWMASEVVAVFMQNKTTLAIAEYGNYLVSARIKSTSSWNQLDKNVAFGLFTYQKEATGSRNNPYRELDLAEISRWGTPPCSNALDPRLCEGNAQFAVQVWDKNKLNVHRYTISEGVREITLVMHWTAANTPVIFSQYDGIYTFANLPAQPAHSDTTTADQNPFIPDVDCQLFHMNMWMGNFGEGEIHPGPTNGLPQEVVVTNFEFRH